MSRFRQLIAGLGTGLSLGPSGGGGGGGGVSFVGSNSIEWFVTSATLPAPVDSLAGDLLCITAHMTTSSASDTIDTPAGWTKVGSKNFADVASIGLFVKVATGDGAANNQAITESTTGFHYASMFALRGVTAVDAAAFYAVGDGFLTTGGSPRDATLSGGLPVPTAAAKCAVACLSSYLGADPSPYTFSDGLTQAYSTYSAISNDSATGVGFSEWDGATAFSTPFVIEHAMSNGANAWVATFK